jgi:tetratricopeptide (TPR) repeat protein
MEEEEKSRLEQFKEFVEMDPTDTFSRYALALEYMGVSDFELSVHHFQEVIRLDPSYSAAYFQAALASEQMQKVDQARDFLIRGIEAAEKKNDWHARDEMKAALANLGE